MIQLPAALSAWGTPAFPDVLKQELERLPAGALPLRAALTHGSHALDEGIGARLIAVKANPATLRARIGIFYFGIIAGCNCADDPSPIEPHPEYCELLLEIDRASARATLTLVDD